MLNIPRYVSAAWIAKQIGTTRQNVTKSGHAALNPDYRGNMIRPDAVVDGAPVWLLGNAEKYIKDHSPAQS